MVMPDQSRFFHFVWRFNALVLAIIGGAALFMICKDFTMGYLWTPPPFGEPVGHFAPVPKAAEKNYTYRLNNTGQYVLGHEEIFTLTRWEGEPQEYGLADIRGSSGSGPSVQNVNLLAVDADGSTSHWLFYGYGRLILTENAVLESLPPAANRMSPTAIPAPGYSSEPAQDAQSVVALVIETVDADTDKDGKITPKDKHSLYVYRAGAVEPVKLLTADDFLSVQQIGSDKYLVICENGKAASAATFSLPDFKLLSEKPLLSVPN